mmetsp:Transcript_124388/g.387261  ORF Transcript_124388/g.387261 Transcript_124388/m.387261 type:complete len:205 (+) Transcript_124388:351-965(+)
MRGSRSAARASCCGSWRPRPRPARARGPSPRSSCTTCWAPSATPGASTTARATRRPSWPCSSPWAAGGSSRKRTRRTSCSSCLPPTSARCAGCSLHTCWNRQARTASGDLTTTTLCPSSLAPRSSWARRTRYPQARSSPIGLPGTTRSSTSTWTRSSRCSWRSAGRRSTRRRRCSTTSAAFRHGRRRMPGWSGCTRPRSSGSSP